MGSVTVCSSCQNMLTARVSVGECRQSIREDHDTAGGSGQCRCHSQEITSVGRH